MNRNTKNLLIISIILLILISVLIFCVVLIFNNYKDTDIDKVIDNFFEKGQDPLNDDSKDFDEKDYEAELIKRGPNKYSGYKILPYNEAKNNTNFYEFYNNLLDVINKKDKEHLLNFIDENIVYGFEENEDGHIHLLYGKNEFIDYWDLIEDKGPDFLWDEIDRILTAGGRFIDENNTVFTAPHFRQELIEMENDLNNNNNDMYIALGLGLDENIPVYELPNINSRVIDYLNYEIVDMLGPTEYENGDKIYYLYKILTNRGKVGYILDIDVNTTFDYHLRIEFKNSSWIVTEFYPGNI